jgi:hypothetical protein
MTTTLFTYQIPNFDKTSTVFVETPVLFNSPEMTEELRSAIANLQSQDIGWLDILSAMANITEALGDDQVACVLETVALSLKRNRKIIRDL